MEDQTTQTPHHTPHTSHAYKHGLSPTVKHFLAGLAVSAIFIVGFFFGGIADRIFVIKPLDYITNRNGAGNSNGSFSSRLGSLIDQKGGSGLSVADVAEVASESVVTVAIKTNQPVYKNMGFGGLFGFQVPQVDRVEQIQRDIGSGFVVSEEGLIVTNKHVVSDDRAEYLVIDSADIEHKVEKIYRDPTNDLAILKVVDLKAPALKLGDSDAIRVGESVIAIGTALGEFRHTVTTGVVSGLGRGIEATDGFSGVESIDDVIQTDAAINPGNSGGPLLGDNGQVIGVNVAVSAQGENVGFALPINVIKASLANFNETGQFDRPFLGVRYALISEQAALMNEVPQGAYIQEIVAGSPAEAGGLEVGDIITKFAGQNLKETTLAELINKQKIGSKVEVELWRSSEKMTVQIQMKASE